MVYFKREIKRAIALMVAMIITIGAFSGCNKKSEAVEGESSEVSNVVDSHIDVLLVTDYGTINDGSYNQGAWEGLMQYAQEKGITAAYYEPENADKESFLEEIKNGVKNGATMVICPGYMFEETVFEAQNKYSNVNFVLLDGQPHNADYSEAYIANNTECIVFAEEQAGFLAGYSAVRDGYTNLGFMGGIPEDSVIRYGYGFVQGADYASIEMGIKVNIRYAYMNTFSDEPIVEATADAWYGDDTEVIFACGGALGKSVMRSAANNDKKVIGVDIDQSSESETVITSAMKSIKEAVYQSLMTDDANSFEGGIVRKYTASENGVCLPMENSRFVKFSQEDYDSILTRLIDGSISPYDGTDIGTTQELTLINTSVNYIVL